MAKAPSIILLLAMSAVAAAIVGCAARRDNSGKPLPVRTEASPLVELPEPRVRISEGVLSVSGLVRRKAGYDGAVPGHLHIDLLTSTGEMLDQLLLSWRPEQVPTVGQRHAAYELKYVAPAEPAVAAVRVAIADDAQEHAFPGPEASGGTGGARMGTPGTLGKPKSGMARRTPGTPRQRSSTPRTPAGSSGRR